MIASWMLYSAAISALLGLSALALDHGLRRRGIPLRWVWTASICGTVALSAAAWLRPTAAERPGSSGPGTFAVAGPLEDGAPASSPVEGTGPESEGGGFGLDAPRRLSIPPLPAFDGVLLRLWLAASGGSLLYLLIGHRRLVRRRRLWREGTVDGVPVLLARRAGPAVVGFARPVIVLPAWVLELDPVRQRLVLAHESEHLRARDPALLLVSFVVAALMPWNAPLWWQVRRLRHAVELDCDARVLSATADVATYGSLLIDVGAQAMPTRLGVAAFAESSSLLAARIRNLAAPRPGPWRLVTAVCVALAGVAAVAACEAPTPAVLDEAGREGAPAAAGNDAAAQAPAAPAGGQAISDSSSTSAAAGSDDATAELEQDGVAPEASAAAVPAAADAAGGHELEVMVRGRPNIENIVELVRHLHPEVHAEGLPIDRALWLAIDRAGTIRRSWVGPNLFINFDTFHPLAWHALPEGSAEERRARSEHAAAVSAVLRENVPELRIQAHAALVGYRPVAMALHFVTEASGRLAWGGRAELAQDIVIRTRLPIEGERLSLPPVQTLTWRGLDWQSRDPARIIRIELLERIGETGGRPLYAEAGVTDPEVIYRLEREPNVFLPFLRPQ